MFESLPLQLALAILLGAAVGLERESRAQELGRESTGGIRTFSLVCLLGSLAGIFYAREVSAIFWMITTVFSLLLIAYYIIGSWIRHTVGLTSELAYFYTFLLGFLITTSILPLQLIIAIFVILMMVLSSKVKSQKIIGGISHHELEAFISYAIVALVVLPFLPDTTYTFTDVPLVPPLLKNYGVDMERFANLPLLNFQRIWFFVVLITGIDVIGYVMAKFMGQKKSFTIASFFGGFVSSTATTLSLAHKSIRSRSVDYWVGAALLANVASFFQVFLLVGPLNVRWLAAITPTLILLIAAGIGVTTYFLMKGNNTVTEGHREHQKKIFALIPALRFALLLMVVQVVTKICLAIFGQSGFMISSILASLAGLDAIIVNLADMAGTTISYDFALLVFLLVNATNLLSKCVYSSLQGTRAFALRFLLSSAIMIPISFLGLVIK